MNQRAISPVSLLCILALAIPCAALLAISLGAIPLSFTEALAALLGQSTTAEPHQLVVQHIRAPRAALAICVGALLAVCGAAMQGLFRNPLADPSLIGVSAGASAGASIAIVFGQWLSFASFEGLPLIACGAFIGGAACATLVYRLASSQHGTSVATMLLAGIAITALAGAVNSLMEFVASNDMLRRISLWRMGGLDSATWTQIAFAGFALLLLVVRLPMHAKALNAFLLGESEARHLGIDVQKIKFELILLVSLGIGIAVALSGTIAFVGLVIPHIVRLLIGPDHRYLLPASALAGALLLLLADSFARTVIEPSELPIGVVTAFLGAPFFISLLRQRHQYGMQE